MPGTLRLPPKPVSLAAALARLGSVSDYYRAPEGTGSDSSDGQLRAIAPKHPAFEVLPAD